MEPPALGKYQLVRKLAAGGMAEVFLAKAAGPMGFEKTLVVKRILPHLADDPQFVEMFLAEAKLAAELNHPNVVQIFDFGQVDGAYFIAMELIDGPNLRTLAERARDLSSPLPFAVSARLIEQACEGLAYAHEYCDPDTGLPLGLVHRDISPDNLLVARNGAVKVVDFGIAKAAGRGHKTTTGMVKGKLAYMPPEQLQAMPVDLRVDVFALGMVLYELATGKKPFDRDTDVGAMQAILYEPFIPARERRPEVPEALERILNRALAKDRDQRHGSCRELASELEAFIRGTGENVSAFRLAQLVGQLVGPAKTQGTPPPRVTTPVGAVGETAAAVPWKATPAPTVAARGSLAVDDPDAFARTSVRPERGPAPRQSRRAVVGAVAAALLLSAGGGAWVAMAGRRGGASGGVTRATGVPAEAGAASRATPRTADEREAAVPSSAAGARSRVEFVPAVGANSTHEAGKPISAPALRSVEVAATGPSAAAPASASGGELVHPPSTPEPAVPTGGPAVRSASATPVKAGPSKSGGELVPTVGANSTRERALSAGAPAARSTDVAATGRSAKVRAGTSPASANAGEFRVGSVPTGGTNPPRNLAAARPSSALASFIVDSEPAGQVRVNGRLVGPAPALVQEVPPGDVRVEVFDPKVGFSRTESFSLTAGDNGTKRIVGRRGKVELRIYPYARVFIDGRELGQTPLPPVELYEGTHAVRLVNKELGKDLTTSVTVRGGESQVLKQNLAN